MSYLGSLFSSLPPYLQAYLVKINSADITRSIVREDVKTREVLSDANTYSTLYKGIYINDKKERLSVAIKVFKKIDGVDDVRIIKRLNRVIDIWRDHALIHPNVLPFLGTCEHVGPTPAIVTPYCQNGPIMDYLHKVPSTDRNSLILGIAKGLAYLHDRGVMHGHLIPSNILILDNGQPAITDFSRARIVGSVGTTTKTNLRLLYLAPEAIKRPNTRTLTKEEDVYAFAMVSLTVITNKSPYRTAKTDAQALTWIAQKQMLKHDDYSEVPDNVWKLFYSCWSFDPRYRPEMETVCAMLTSPGEFR